jgi:hypothetical protein
MPDQTLAKWNALFADPTPQAALTSATPALYQTSLTSTYFVPPPAVTSTRLQTLAPETEQARTQGLLSSVNLLNGLLVTEAEMAKSEGGTTWLQNKIPGDTREDASGQMRVSASPVRRVGPIRHSLPLRRTSFHQWPDQAMREVGENGSPDEQRYGAPLDNNGIT